MRWKPLAAVLLAAGLQGAALADAYPSQPITIVVPFPPGGGVDTFARTVGQQLALNTGANIVIDNKPGASGIIGTGSVARARPDGYTLVIGTPGPMTIAAAAGRKIPYDPVKDFTPVSVGALLTPVLVVGNDSPLRSVKDVIAAARSRPEGVSFASSGMGTSLHLAGELFAQLAGVKLLHVPFQGIAPGLVAVGGGQVDMGFSDPTAISLVHAGKLRALAVGAPKRIVQLPDVPTVAESGLPAYANQNWYSFHGPAGLPAPVVDYLNRELGKALRTPAVQEKLQAAGMAVAPSTPAELDTLVRQDLDTWRKVIVNGNIKLD